MMLKRSVPPYNSKNRTIKQERGTKSKTDTNCWWAKKKKDSLVVDNLILLRLLSSGKKQNCELVGKCFIENISKIFSK